MRIPEVTQPAIIIINDPRSTQCSCITLSCKVIILFALIFTGMMVKPHSSPFHIGDIRQYIIRVDLHQTILDIFGMDKLDIINQVELFQDCRTTQAIKI